MISGFSALRSVAMADPARIALVSHRDTRRVTTYAELDGRARRVAAALVQAALRPGDRVALLGDSNEDLVAAWLGAFAANRLL